MSTFGQNLKEIRVGRGMSLEEIGRLLGTTKQVLSRYENGHRDPKISTVTRYAGKLGVDVRDLLSGQEPPSTASPPQTRVVISGGGTDYIYSIDSRVVDWLRDLLARLEIIDHIEVIEHVMKMTD